MIKMWWALSWEWRKTCLIEQDHVRLDDVQNLFYFSFIALMFKCIQFHGLHVPTKMGVVVCYFVFAQLNHQSIESWRLYVGCDVHETFIEFVGRDAFFHRFRCVNDHFMAAFNQLLAKSGCRLIMTGSKNWVYEKSHFVFVKRFTKFWRKMVPTFQTNQKSKDEGIRNDFLYQKE